MDATQAVILVGIGLFGGVWNAIAGGATLFTFPALMAVGLPPVVANVTNYLALLPSKRSGPSRLSGGTARTWQNPDAANGRVMCWRNHRVYAALGVVILPKIRGVQK